MGVVQINQIRRRLHETTHPHVDVSDVSSQSDDNVEQMRLSRSLAAFVLTKVTGLAATDAAAAITDGSGDNGIDAIAIVGTERPRLIVVQSKWSDSGKNGASLTDMMKFQRGLDDLVSFRWSRFNDKVTSRSAEIDEAVNDPNVRIEAIFASMGAPPLSEDVSTHMTDYLAELNDTSEIASFNYLSQTDLHRLLIEETLSKDIDLTVDVSDWGKLEGPPAAIYGHVSGAAVASWLADNGEGLLARNVRVVLGDTEVNNSVVETVIESPKNFWYFNNGITVLCDSVGKAPVGGTERRQGTFEFRGVSVVNGAQTVGSLHRAAKLGKASELDNVRVMVRFISLEASDDEFAKRVTRATNTQNLIGGRDFVGLDPTQKRLADEFSVEGLKYVVRNGETRPSPEEGCEFTEAAIALACAQSASLAAQAKREVSRLWDDTSKAPYKILFNPTVSYLRIWRAVQILRVVDTELAPTRASSNTRKKGYAIHGNRLLTHIVFKRIPASKLEDHDYDWTQAVNLARSVVKSTFESLFKIGEEQYGGYTAILFKNVAKTEHLTKLVLIDIATPAVHKN
ncbi:AIPR family protein [Rhodococcoides kyotonense]|uniref:AIPR protein n=1 Tax=Rhodococcoides kyotonense TaxID=398843 RepID=A0A239IND3_9NOCA|nr:AIPR family protein [Rhodococcus kyotonensis]SNS95266.1 AIPR protein [Rhodococcus kyotonensis]